MDATAFDATKGAVKKGFVQPLGIMAALLQICLQVDLARISQLLSLFLVLEERLLPFLLFLERGL